MFKSTVMALAAASTLLIGVADVQATTDKTKSEAKAKIEVSTRNSSNAGVKLQKPAAQRAIRPASVESGVASVYCFRNGPTASGERSRPALLTAAHKTLPFGTLIEVTNRHNGRSIVVRINDRGPYVGGRVIDLTPAGARALKFDGLAHVTLRVLNNRRDLQLAARAL